VNDNQAPSGVNSPNTGSTSNRSSVSGEAGRHVPVDAVNRKAADSKASGTNGKAIVPPADLPKRRLRDEKVTAAEIRELCDLVRKRFSLDVDLWDLRHAKPRDREYIWDRIYQADAALHKIRRTLASWDRRDLFESKEDWETFNDIKRRINSDNKRDWIAHPPWSE